jgi:hypothetical protein
MIPVIKAKRYVMLKSLALLVLYVLITCGMILAQMINDPVIPRNSNIVEMDMKPPLCNS